MIGATIVGAVGGAAAEGAGGDEESTDAGPMRKNVKLICVFISTFNHKLKTNE